MLDISDLPVDSWQELRLHVFDEGARTYAEIYTLSPVDTRVFTLATVNEQGLVDVECAGDYPQEVQHFFAAQAQDGSRLIGQKAFASLVDTMRQITADHGYNPQLWAGAMVMYNEATLMRALHGADHNAYTYEDCIRLIDRFGSSFTYWELGGFIDRGIAARELLQFSAATPYSYLASVYPAPAR